MILLALALGLALRTWVIGAVRVAGTSMSGTLVSGDVALVLRAPFEPRRGDVVECRFPGRGDTYIKRVIGLPGETIAFENGGLRVNGVETPEPFRADGLHRILYKCPRCGAEGETEGKGTRLVCHRCGTEYEMDTLGRMRASEGETEFAKLLVSVIIPV